MTLNIMASALGITKRLENESLVLMKCLNELKTGLDSMNG